MIYSSPGVIGLYRYSSCSWPQARLSSCKKASAEYRAAPEVLVRQSSSSLSLYLGCAVSPVFLSIEPSGEVSLTCSRTSQAVVGLGCLYLLVLDKG